MKISLLLLLLFSTSSISYAQEVIAMRVNEKVWSLRSENKEEKPIVIEDLFERCYWYAHPFYVYIKSDEIVDIGVYDGGVDFYIFAFKRDFKKIETHTLHWPGDGLEDMLSHDFSTRNLAALKLLASNGESMLACFDDKISWAETRDILWLSPLTITDVLAEIAYYTYRDDYILPPTARLTPQLIGKVKLLAVRPRKIRKY